MEKVTRELNLKNKGFYLLSVIILLFFLNSVECQRFNTRLQRPGFQRQGFVGQRTRNQVRREPVGTRDQSLGNRRTQMRGQQNEQPGSIRRQRIDRLRREREYLDNKIQMQNAALRQEMLRSDAGRRTNVRVQTGRNLVRPNRGRRISPAISTRQRHNFDINRNFDNNNARTLRQSTDNSGQNSRTNSRNSRREHIFVRPRGRSNNVESSQITSDSRRRSNIYTPRLNLRGDKQQYLPVVQKSLPEQVQTMRHFKPFNPDFLRRISARNKGTSASVLSNSYSALRSTDSSLIASRQIHPTYRSFPEKLAVHGNTNGISDANQDQIPFVNTLGAPVKKVQVYPTQSTLVQQQSVVGQRVQKILVPFPSVVPQHETSNGPVQVLSRTDLPNGDTLLRVIPAVSSAVPTAKSIAPLKPQSSQIIPGLVLSSGVNAGRVPANNLHVPAVVQPNHLQHGVLMTNTAVEQSIPVQNAAQQVVLAGNSVQQNVHVPNAVQQSILVPNTALQGVHVPGTVQRNVIVPNSPLQQVLLPNRVQQSAPAYSWANHILLGGEQPDSPDIPDPTDAVKTVTELVDLLTSTLGNSTAGASEEEEEEIEWEDRPPTTTTTTTTTMTPIPTTQELTTPAASVIKSIAEQIVSLLVQRSGGSIGSSPKNQPVRRKNTHSTRVVVRPTFASRPLVTNNQGTGSIIIHHGEASNSRPVVLPKNVLIEAVQPTIAAFSEAGHSLVSTTNEESPGTAKKTKSESMINLNDVIMANSLPRPENTIDLGAVARQSVQQILENAKSIVASNSDPTPITKSLPRSENTIDLGGVARQSVQQILENANSLVASNSDPTPITKSLPRSENTIDLGGVASQSVQQILENANGLVASNSNATPIKEFLPRLENTIDLGGVVLQPYMSSNDLGGLSVKKIIKGPAQEQGFQGIKARKIKAEPVQRTSVQQILEKIKSLVALNSNPTSTMKPLPQSANTIGLDGVAFQSVQQILENTKGLVASNSDTNPITKHLPQATNTIDLGGVALQPYMSSNDLGGLSVKKIKGPAQEPGSQKTKERKIESKPGQRTSVEQILEKLQSLVASNHTLKTNPTPTLTTTTKAPPTTITTSPTPPIVAITAPLATRKKETCTPRSPNFRCKGKDLFLTMESIGPWCLGMCIKKGCIKTVCDCGCNISPTKPSPSEKSLTPAQRWQMMNSFGPPPWARTTKKPVTTEEPPEEEEWEEEDGTTTKAPVTPSNPWQAHSWELSGNTPSPESDFRLNPIDTHTSNAQKIDRHVSEINKVAWATAIKSRLKVLAGNAEDSSSKNAFAGSNADQTGKSAPDWQGTEWHLQTPPTTKAPTTQKSIWQGRRPLRDKWGRSERFAGGGDSQPVNAPGWNSWNNQWQMNPFGNMFGGDSRLSRLRFNWGGSRGSGGSGGEEEEANDRK